MRRSNPAKRDVQPDPIFEDKLITRFVNNLMKDGKKNVARKIYIELGRVVLQNTCIEKQRLLPACFEANKLQVLFHKLQAQIKISSYFITCEIFPAAYGTFQKTFHISLLYFKNYI